MDKLKERAFKEMEEEGLLKLLPNEIFRATDKGIVERNKLMILISMKE